MWKRKNKLLKRVESLEAQLGYTYSIDADGYISHVVDANDKYSDIPEIRIALKDLEVKKKK